MEGGAIRDHVHGQAGQREPGARAWGTRRHAAWPRSIMHDEQLSYRLPRCCCSTTLLHLCLQCATEEPPAAQVVPPHRASAPHPAQQAQQAHLPCPRRRPYNISKSTPRLLPSRTRSATSAQKYVAVGSRSSSSAGEFLRSSCLTAASSSTLAPLCSRRMGWRAGVRRQVSRLKRRALPKSCKLCWHPLACSSGEDQHVHGSCHSIEQICSVAAAAWPQLQSAGALASPPSTHLLQRHIQSVGAQAQSQLGSG